MVQNAETQDSQKKNIHFQSAEGNTVKLLSVYPAKLSFMLQDEIKAFSSEGEWKEAFSSKLILKECLEKVLMMGSNQRLWALWNKREKNHAKKYK